MNVADSARPLAPSTKTAPNRPSGTRTLVTTKRTVGHPDTEAVVAALANAEHEGFWLDVEAPDNDDYQLLDKVFRFHPLTIEDVRHQNQRPKLEEYPGYAFLVLFQAELGTGEDVQFVELHVFLAKDYLVTVHNHPSPALRALTQRLGESPELCRGDPGFIAYLVLDEVIDSMFPILERLDERIDDLEARIVLRGDFLLAEINQFKRRVIELRRHLGAERDVFQRLITHSLDFRSEELTLYWRDVYDHLVRQYETADSLRDLLSNATDIHISLASNRLNNTMKALTVIASLFLPLTFLTGFYGMNFAFLTQVLETPRLAFAVGILTMVISIAVQLYYFRRRGWI